MKSYKAYELRISVWDGEALYDILGAQLADGRVITYGTGEGLADQLWRSLVDFEPNGGDAFQSACVSSKIKVSVARVIRAATGDFDGLSLLTAEETEMIK